MRSRRAKRIGLAIPYVVVGAWLVVTLTPIVWIFLESLKPPRDVFAIPPKWLFVPSLDNYRALLSDTSGEFVHNMLNTVIVTVGEVILGLAIGLPAAYALSFFRVRHRTLWLTLVLLASMLPPITLLIPLYIFWQNLQLLDTYVCLVVTYATLSLPFVIWMLRGFMREIPRELIDAAQVDGAGQWGTLLRVVVPLVGPGIAATSIFTALGAWNELLFAVVLTTFNARMATPALALLISDKSILWGRLYAGGSLVVLPIILFTFAVQRHIVRGFTLGAVKG